MSKIKLIPALIGLLTLIQFHYAATVLADGSKLNNKLQKKYSETFVTPQSNPEHYIRYNASRTCGKGYNPMDKRHRRHHRFKRPHGHIYPPWQPGCPE